MIWRQKWNETLEIMIKISMRYFCNLSGVKMVVQGACIFTTNKVNEGLFHPLVILLLFLF
ncbi:hypothetical protein AVP43_02075 [Geobacillus stearothermophilus]|nr:hypothetical protein AVP43_02075 [Geobacillus stearothermophilus]